MSDFFLFSFHCLCLCYMMLHSIVFLSNFNQFLSSLQFYNENEEIVILGLLLEFVSVSHLREWCFFVI